MRSLVPGTSCVEGFCTVVPGGNVNAGSVIAVGGAPVALLDGAPVAPVVVRPVGPPVGVLGVVLSGVTAGAVTPPGGVTLTCAVTCGGVQISKTQPTNGDHMNCTRVARMIMGVAGHPGTDRMMGWSKVRTAA